FRFVFSNRRRNVGVREIFEHVLCAPRGSKALRENGLGNQEITRVEPVIPAIGLRSIALPKVLRATLQDRARSRPYSKGTAGEIIEDLDPDWGTTFRRPAAASPATRDKSCRSVDRDLATNHAVPDDLFARHAIHRSIFLILGKTETDRPLNFLP